MKGKMAELDQSPYRPKPKHFKGPIACQLCGDKAERQLDGRVQNVCRECLPKAKELNKA